MIMSQTRDGGMGGLEDIVGEGLWGGDFFLHFYVMWSLSFGTKKLLVVARRYCRVSAAEKKNKEDQAHPATFKFLSLLSIHLLIPCQLFDSMSATHDFRSTIIYNLANRIFPPPR